MRVWIVGWAAVVALLAGPLAARCDAQATLVWNPPPSPGVAGYNLCWGTKSGVYLYTNVYPAAQTNATISNLLRSRVYCFAVQAFDSNGDVSMFSSEVDYTNVSSGLPPAPPVPPGGNSPTNPGTNSSNTTSSSNITQSLFWGVPPFLGMTVSNGQANLNIGGTVGATVIVESTTNPVSMDLWSALANVAITNTASIAQTNPPGQVQDILDVAFVPGTQTLPVAAAHSAPFQFFRVTMPYDYVILADLVLPGKGYTPRLIVVNLPGIVCDDVCYVNEASSFIHYSKTNYVLELEASGSTIREIATALANSLNLEWTSASEFTYSNGLGQILATVIETEAPSSDPVAGQNPPSSPIVIDF